MGTIAENLRLVRQRIEAAAARVGRDPSLIKLVAVSKTKTPEEIAEAVAAGQYAFGENYAQELREKSEAGGSTSPIPSLQRRGIIEWHFIGHLQKNKAKIVAPIISWIETIDSLELAEALDKRATHLINCLIEVNIGNEESKSGIPPTEIPNLIKGFDKFRNLKLKGLMTIPPFSNDPEASRPYFKQLKSLLTGPLTELSMGMSHDFEVAIEEGATIIRVGTAIFGERG